MQIWIKSADAEQATNQDEDGDAYNDASENGDENGILSLSQYIPKLLGWTSYRNNNYGQEETQSNLNTVTVPTG